MSIRIRVYVIAALFSLQAPVLLAWNIENVFQGMSVNVTRSGSYQNQAAGYSTNVGNRYIICQYEKSIKKNR
ncbi:conjugal transfer protein TraH [Orientia tsutsugamushi]|uniref:Conjugal transfer protein TraH n=1 Tax=Orientia tsutsugamushi TaxID=784 RepID=A0A2U3RG35_ORITS|nr:hypothetical protein [Orientia tsutsugamushi]KJV76735.1 putative conjugative transfer TraH domain protein [Orientia tsutsugamushi str. UT76]SPR12189.1 conjugal transfer protein TraH [Orientia tsutsugamushi]